MINPLTKSIPHRLTYAQACEHRKLAEQTFAEWALELEAQILAIEDPSLRFAVAVIVDMVSDSENCGAFIVADEGKQYRLIRMDLDADIANLLASKIGGLEQLQQACTWICERLNERPIAYIAWALGPIDIDKRRGVGLCVVQGNLVYSLKDRRLLGVCRNGSNYRPGDKLLPLRDPRIVKASLKATKNA